MSLITGQVVRYASALWRVDYVNSSRARLVPLAKRHVVLADDEGGVKREFDSEQRGVNISPDSPLEVVEDIERTKMQIELEETERELAALKAEAEREAKAEAARAAKAQAKARQGTAQAASGVRTSAEWAIGPTAVEGPLSATKAAVFAFVSAHPGASTKAVAAGCTEHSAGAVAACLDRFRKAGHLVKNS